MGGALGVRVADRVGMRVAAPAGMVRRDERLLGGGRKVELVDQRRATCVTARPDVTRIGPRAVWVGGGTPGLRRAATLPIQPLRELKSP